MMGGALGLVVAVWSTSVPAKMAATAALSIDLAVHPNGRVFAFTAALCLLTGLLFGLAPAIRASRVAVSAALNGSKENLGGSSRWFSLGKVLVVLQVALSIVLLIGAGLFARTLGALKSVDMGFDR